MSRRLLRINEIIKRVVSEAIIKEVKDPRVGFITVTRAEIMPDFSEATVYFSRMGTEKEQRLSLSALNHMTGFLQKGLGPALKIRRTPILRFEIDDAMAKAFKINALIDKARESDGSNANTSDSDDSIPDGSIPDGSISDGSVGDGTNSDET